jgi:lysophospholipase L1-like esterase
LGGVALLGMLVSSATATQRRATAPPDPCASAHVVPPSAPAAGSPFSISASAAHVGCIELYVSGASSGPVTLTETTPRTPVGGPLGVVTPVDGRATLPQGLEWRCEPTTRSFQAAEMVTDGTEMTEQTATTSVQTPDCASRFTVTFPTTRLHRGYPLTLTLRDRWGQGGLIVHACESGTPARACPAARLKPSGGATAFPVLLRHGGHPEVEIFDAFQRVRQRLNVSDSRPLLLATGDSEMQVLDDILGSDLSGTGGATVVGDAHQSTAISSPFFFNWPAHGVSQVDSVHPDIVAMFLGGNEGFRLGDAECCSAAWSREYAARVAGMIREYRQNGAAVVYWFLIPTPAHEPFVRVVRAVNAGIIRAVSEFPSGVHVFDLRPIFSPGERYIDSLTYEGQTITAHEPDGFHLSAEADQIVARLFIRRLRAEGVFP